MDLNLPEKRTFTGPAGIWKRLLAFLIDLFLVDFFLVGPMRSVLRGVIGEPETFEETFALLQSSPSGMDSLILIFILVTVFILVYFVLCQYLVGQTIGCMVLKMKVVAMGGGLPGFWQCVLRNLFVLPFIPFILLWVADPVFYFAARRHQRMSEWLSGTQVIMEYSY